MVLLSGSVAKGRDAGRNGHQHPGAKAAHLVGGERSQHREDRAVYRGWRHTAACSGGRGAVMLRRAALRRGIGL